LSFAGGAAATGCGKSMPAENTQAQERITDRNDLGPDSLAQAYKRGLLPSFMPFSRGPTKGKSASIGNSFEARAE